jgi:cytochrome c553
MIRFVLAAALTASLSAPAPALSANGDPATGRKLAAQCQTCHGIDGLAKVPIAPHLAGENFTYLQTQLRNYRSGKREHEIMTIVAQTLSDEDIDNLAAWYSSIRISVALPE